MADPITLRVITPERVVLDTTCSHVSFPAIGGSVGVLKDHAPMVAALGVGELAFRGSDDGETGMFVAGGFAEVRSNTVRVVTEASEPPDQIDVERATEAAKRARERLEEFQTTPREEIDLLRARLALHRALMRERIAGKYSQR